MLRQLGVLVLGFLAVIFYSGSSNVAAQVTFVKTVGTASETTTGNQTVVSVPATGVALGNRVIVILALNPASGNVSCSDSRGNSYALDRNVRNGSATNGVRLVVLSAPIITALVGGDTIACTHPNVTARAMSVNEFSGLLATSAVDRKSSKTGNNAIPSSGATAKTTQPMELLMGGIGVEGPVSEAFTAGASYTVVGRAGTNAGADASNITVTPEYRIVNTTGAYSATATLGASRRWAAAIVTYRAGPATIATKLAITSVNGGANPTAGGGFPVVVQAQDNGGTPRNVTANTGVVITLKSGTGALGGTLTGTIAAGTNQVTINGATYTKAESGVVITAARSSGDALAPGDSASFTVNAGLAAELAFTIQPGSASAGATLPGPPTVSVKDSFGNTVVSSTASIAIGIGANPGGGVLTGTTTRSAVSGVAAFTDLAISQLGTGYRLTASSAGLTPATSDLFNVTAPTGGIIAGTITRASNGAAISGALVEAIQGTSVVASTTTNSSGTYSISGLSSGSYAVRASFAGFVPQSVNSVAVSSGSTTNVDLSLKFGIAIQSPAAGSTVNDFSVLVTGLFDKSLASEVGIQVNGYVALQDGDEFTAIIPLDSQTTTLTATMKNVAGNQLASDVVPITLQLPSNAPRFVFRPSPALALVSQLVGFTLDNRNPIAQIELDANGDGSIDFTGTTLQGFKVTFAESGLYFPTVKVTEVGGAVRNATAVIQIFDPIQLDTFLQNKWQSMKDFIRTGNIAAALNYIALRDRGTYENMLNALTVPFADIDQALTNITLVRQQGKNVEYKMNRIESGLGYSYLVIFTIDEDGIWRIKFF